MPRRREDAPRQAGQPGVGACGPVPGTLNCSDHAGAAGPKSRTAAYWTPPFVPLTKSVQARFRAWPGARGAPCRRDQSASNRSRVITLVHASTKSATNFSCASSAA